MTAAHTSSLIGFPDMTGWTRAERHAAADERRQRFATLPAVAVITRTGGLVHLPDMGSVMTCGRLLTLCGRDSYDIHTPDVSLAAVTCVVCRRKREEFAAAAHTKEPHK